MKNAKNSGKTAPSADDDDDKCESVLYTFPMSRISRMIKSENSKIKMSQEATFVINKATEKFLELFCKEAYACAFLDRKSHVGYNHLSSVVSKRQRFDFLSGITNRFF
nr:ABC transporter F family member 4 [Ipomoea batatas]